MPKSIIERRRLEDRAIELLQAGFRTTTVTLETGLPDKVVRAIYRELHGKPAHRGAMRDVRNILSTAWSTDESTLYLWVYARLHPEFEQSACIDKALAAYRIYSEVRAEWLSADSHRLEINDCWTLCRAARGTSLVRLTRCPCSRGVPVLHGEAVRHPGCMGACHSSATRINSLGPKRTTLRPAAQAPRAALA